jgi:hypothetical protein
MLKQRIQVQPLVQYDAVPQATAPSARTRSKARTHSLRDRCNQVYSKTVTRCGHRDSGLLHVR